MTATQNQPATGQATAIGQHTPDQSAATLGRQLAEFAAAYGPGGRPLPEAVTRSVAQRVLDILGIAVAATSLPTSAAVIELARERGGRPAARAIGLTGRVPASEAALVHGVLAHSLDYDDTHLPSVLHPSASVVPAALAAGDEVGADGAQVTAAIAVGLEICVRVGMAGYDRASGVNRYFERGQHATSLCGALGSAAAAAKLYRLDADGILHALGIAASMASGIIEGNRTGGTVKRMHCGWAAHAGVWAAQLAQRGFTGPETLLEGRFGLFQAFLGGEFDAEAVTEGLGRRWEVPGIFFKPYPANHFTHAGIDAAIALRERGLRAADVAAVELGVPTATVRTIGEPLAVKQAPETGYQAQFSGPYTIAAALLGGGGLGLGLDDFTDELARDPVRRELMGRVTVVADARCDAIFPNQFPAVLRVRTHDGTWLEEAVLANRGGSERPLSDDEVAGKFRDNAARVLPAERVEAIAAAARALPDAPSIDDLLGALTAADGVPR
ncbi:MmgE/PrpD family protein [Micromonospora yangpuensis]|uniref:2-methylcitrate dehydratase PrpD n=1 Tax=Micromonospora yangpuensis TaxID=683228 RepID=A0A1C6UP69_9ACTN|nr:MmgE/PrpD family protein [Micromonospora yangpuensis]SCL55827.1 2-methylcitrate dehydratase PrpD [Micromonospora yangpuensis]